MLQAPEQGSSQLEQPIDLPLSEYPNTKRHQNAKRNRLGRVPIPEHMELVEIVLDIPEQEKICPETGKPMNMIGWEVSEKLEYRPGKLTVNIYKKPEYVSSDSSTELGVLMAPMPDHPIEKCKADIELPSYIIMSSFCIPCPCRFAD